MAAGHAGLLLTSALLLVTGCSLNRMAVNRVGDAMAGSGSTFASDDDPDFIAAATPFSLKLIESLLNTSPRHQGLLLAAASGFTQYAYAFIQMEADSLADVDVQRATVMHTRARRMYLRARDYGLRGLDARHAGFPERLRADPRAAVRTTRRADVPYLYWTAASWGAAIAVSKEIPELVADQLVVEALMDRALALDETFDAGAIHTFLISYETVRQGSAGEPNERARRHFARAVQLSDGRMASPFVSLAEAVSIGEQNRVEFDSLLRRALAIDADARPEWRLANLLMQRRARWLLGRADELFLDVERP